MSFTSCVDALISLEQDVALGKQLRDEIYAGNQISPLPQGVPKLIPDNQANSAKYQYIRTMVREVLDNAQVKGVLNHRNDFPWEVYLIDDNQTLNAFCAPGGYIYVYSGLVKFLDKPDDLAGVIGHEIAHADCRHSTKQMIQQYGLQLITQIALGDNQGGQLGQIATGLTSLAFSRGHEKEADEYSVKYLCGSNFASNGAASFFDKLIQTGQTGGTPAFLSTHPNPENRVANINANAQSSGCSTATYTQGLAAYNAFKASL